MPESKLSCNVCGQRIMVAEAHPGAIVPCPTCGSDVLLPDSSSVTASAHDLAVANNCPACGKALTTEIDGCPGCGWRMDRDIEGPSGTGSSTKGSKPRKLLFAMIASFAVAYLFLLLLFNFWPGSPWVIPRLDRHLLPVAGLCLIISDGRPEGGHLLEFFYDEFVMDQGVPFNWWSRKLWGVAVLLAGILMHI